MRSYRLPMFLFSALVAAQVCAAEVPAQSQSPALVEHSKAIQAKREAIKTDRRKAELLKDTDSLQLLDTLDKFLAVQSVCFQKPEEIEADICVMTTLKQLAKEKNFIAEHELGNLYFNSYGNTELAQVWFKKALENPKTPRAYKIIILKSMDAASVKPEANSESQTQTPAATKEQGAQ